MALGRTAVNHEIIFEVEPGHENTLEMVYSTDTYLPSVTDMAQDVKRYREALKNQAGFLDEVAKTLSVSANQFISYRASTDNQTILAGFPFFEQF